MNRIIEPGEETSEQDKISRAKLDEIIKLLHDEEYQVSLQVAISLACTVLAMISATHEDARHNYSEFGSCLAEGLCEAMNQRLSVEDTEILN